MGVEGRMSDRAKNLEDNEFLDHLKKIETANEYSLLQFQKLQSSLSEVESNIVSKLNVNNSLLLCNGQPLSEIGYNGDGKEDRKNKRVENVLNNSNFFEAAYTATNNPYVLLFSRAHYVKTIEVVVQSGHQSDLTGFYIQEPSKKLQTTEPIIDGRKKSRIVYEVNSQIIGFYFNLPISIVSVEVVSTTPSDVSKVMENLLEVKAEMFSVASSIRGGIQNYFNLTRERIKSKRSEVDQLSTQISTLQEEKGRLDVFISQDKGILKSVKEDISRERKSLDSSSLKLHELNGEVSVLLKKNNEAILTKKNLYLKEVELNNSISTIEQQIKSKHLELESVHEKISKGTAKADTYTRDLSGHMKESRIQLGCYMLLALTLIGFTSFIFWEVYDRASSLIGSFNTAQDTNIWQLLLSRSPLILATTVLLTGFLALLFFTVNHIISLNKDRMNMLKASILAEQISVSLANDFALTRAQRLEQSKKLKVEIIMKLFESQQPTSKLDAKNMSIMTQAIDTILKVKKQTQ
ncbi:hypothetical protein EKG38_23370 [Shewanella canadensis]|uniref:Uncharacterized protein n=1 Tax=Shewanella canadensis TaxID=271096 RepID=A0A431WLT9_9GAMM|nr:hypothetical protein [Shewanella canadensis]RTR36562.1 hypothetical protein EKG38_23370 [Shewanella canadensis]